MTAIGAWRRQGRRAAPAWRRRRRRRRGAATQATASKGPACIPCSKHNALHMHLIITLHMHCQAHSTDCMHPPHAGSPASAGSGRRRRPCGLTQNLSSWPCLLSSDTQHDLSLGTSTCSSARCAGASSEAGAVASGGCDDLAGCGHAGGARRLCTECEYVGRLNQGEAGHRVSAK